MKVKVHGIPIEGDSADDVAEVAAALIRKLGIGDSTLPDSNGGGGQSSSSSPTTTWSASDVAKFKKRISDESATLVEYMMKQTEPMTSEEMAKDMGKDKARSLGPPLGVIAKQATRMGKPSPMQTGWQGGKQTFLLTPGFRAAWSDAEDAQ